MLRVRVAGHFGTSQRAGIDLGVKEKSDIRDHTSTCKATISIKTLKLLIFKEINFPESLHKNNLPLYSLNND